MDHQSLLTSTAWPANSLLGRLSAPTREALLRLGTRRVHPDGDRLILEGEPGRHAFLLLQGWFKVLASTDRGPEALMAIRCGGDLVGELSLIDGRPRSASVRAAGNGVSRQIDRAAFFTFLARHEDASAEVLHAMAGKLRWATRRRQEFSSGSVQVRVARVLVELVRSYGRPDRDGRATCSMISQSDLAALVGASDATMYRCLRDLRSKNVIHTGYRRLTVLDLDVLQDIAGFTDRIDLTGTDRP